MAVALLMLFTGCASERPNFESSPIPDPTPNVVDESPAIRPGDLIEVNYYEAHRAPQSIYTLHRGDVLAFNLVGEPDTQAGSILVQEDGYASFPVVGQVRVVGKTMDQLKEELVQLFSERYYSDPLLNLTLVSAYSVAQADLASLSNVPGANQFRVKVPENGRISLSQLGVFNALRSPDALEGEVKKRLAARYGDRYGASLNVVDRAPRVVFVTGAVNEPGEVAVTGPMTPLHAIASAGGFADTAAPRNVAIIRYDRNGGTQSWIVDMRETLVSGGRSQVPVLLRPRDVVYVPRSDVVLTNALIQQYILKNLPFGIGVSYTLN